MRVAQSQREGESASEVGRPRVREVGTTGWNMVRPEGQGWHITHVSKYLKNRCVEERANLLLIFRQQKLNEWMQITERQMFAQLELYNNQIDLELYSNQIYPTLNLKIMCK